MMNIGNVIDTIDTARDANSKAREMLFNFFDDDVAGSIKDSLQVMHDMRTQPMDKWGDEELRLFDWVSQRRTILLKFDIVYDYVKKTADNISSIDRKVRELREALGGFDKVMANCDAPAKEEATLEDESENQSILDTFMESLSPDQLTLYLRVEEDLVAKVIREMNEEARASA